MVVSTFILVAGFASSIFASFRPTIHFGLLTSLTILLSLLCTIVVLPVCLLILKPFGSQRLFIRRSLLRESLPQSSVQVPKQIGDKSPKI